MRANPTLIIWTPTPITLLHSCYMCGVIRCVVLGVAFVTDERHTVKPPNKRQLILQVFCFLLRSSPIVLPKMEWGFVDLISLG